MNILMADGVEQEQVIFSYFFNDPEQLRIARIFATLLDDLGKRYLTAGFPLSSRKIAILGRGGKKFSALTRIKTEFQAAFPGAINRDVTAQLSHFRDGKNFGVAQLFFIRSTLGSPLPDARILACSILATVRAVDWSNLESWWAGLAEQSGCDWGVLGQPFANRTVGKCVVHIGDGLVTTVGACESVFSATGIDPRTAFRSFVVGETRVALFRDPNQAEDEPSWLETVSLLAERIMEVNQHPPR
jgi:hypothetical protein